MDSDKILETLAELSNALDKMGLMLTIIKKPKYKRDYVLYCSPETILRKAAQEMIPLAKYYGAINLKERREALGISRRQMAIQLGYDHNIVTRLENDNYPHNRKYLLRLSEYFNCPVSDFLVDEDERESERERERGGERG